ncbi:MAG: aminotransferase class V-fold PLP-dependent enzyme [Gemmatimonadetes bacterium]|nr:aminotransferase class V-fold PLP-dependent enzyme [Gemmatimonadota bacterium]MYG16510.1 aminotransferase class V-fold PLP-dependent enzyme [Gemmatimonadota bacterium]
MSDNEGTIKIDSRIQDTEKIRSLSRRGFLGSVMAGAAGVAGASTLLSSVTEAEAEPLPDLPATPPGGAAPDDESYWKGVADQFLLRDGVIYMNSGTRGISPMSVHKAQIDAVEAVNSDPAMCWSTYFFSGMDKIRQDMADFVGADVEEIAITNSTTDGMGLGFMGLDLKQGDEILTTNYDYGWVKNMMAFRAKRDGLVFKMVDISDPEFRVLEDPQKVIDTVEAGITPRTRFLTICHINYTDGFIMPVKEICEMARSRGIITLIDGAQPPGMMKLDMKDLACDMYAGPGHKYMLAAQHTGFLFVRNDIVDRVHPLVYTGSSNPEFAVTGARKLEQRGSTSYSDRVSIGAALDFHNKLTREAVEARLYYLSLRLRHGLKAIDGVTVYGSDDPKLSMALISFSIKDLNPSDIVGRLWYRSPNIYIRTVGAAGGFSGVRATLHVMDTADQVDTLIDRVAGLAES